LDPELGRFGGDAHITGQGQLATAAQAIAGYGRDITVSSTPPF
jgi:hypothetical protein